MLQVVEEKKENGIENGMENVMEEEEKGEKEKKKGEKEKEKGEKEKGEKEEEDGDWRRRLQKMMDEIKKVQDLPKVQFFPARFVLQFYVPKSVMFLVNFQWESCAQYILSVFRNLIFFGFKLQRKVDRLTVELIWA